MPLMFTAPKSLKHSAKKSAARDPLERTLLEREVGADGYRTAPPSRGAFHARPCGPKREWSSARAPTGGPPLKRIRAESNAPSQSAAASWPPAAPPPPQSPEGRPGGKGAGKSSAKADAYNAMVQEIHNLVGKVQPAGIQQLIDAKFAGADTGKYAMRRLLGNYCQHCLRNFKALVQRSVGECKKAGNPPSHACPTCSLHSATAYHWPGQCPYCVFRAG